MFPIFNIFQLVSNDVPRQSQTMQVKAVRALQEDQSASARVDVDICMVGKRMSKKSAKPRWPRSLVLTCYQV